MVSCFMSDLMVHRRTGGLENQFNLTGDRDGVHRRTGGLEKIEHFRAVFLFVHRRTGGLEIQFWLCL